MKNLHKRALITALVALLSVGVVGAAVAAGTNKGRGKAATTAKAKAAAKAKASNANRSHGGGGRGGDELDAAAAYLGLPVAQIRSSLAGGQTLAQIAAATNGKTTAGLIAALVAAERTEIAAKVTAGRITQAQADAIIPTLTATFTAYVNGTGGPHGRGGPGGHGGPGGGHSDELDAAATYLGLTAADLITKVQAGQTLAQIAAATPGKNATDLVAALVAAEKVELAAAVTAGRITQAQADAIIPTLTATFTAFVNGTGGPHGAGGPGGHGGHSEHHGR
jgi:hypothetical protein